MSDKNFYVYILTNKTNTTLYIGITSNLIQRVYQHKKKLVGGFSNHYNINKLVYYEIAENAYAAITREKQLKSGKRQTKVHLMNTINPKWEDLYHGLL